MKKPVKITLSVILGIIIALFINGVYYVFWGQEKSAAKLDRGQELNLYECCSIYTMHMAVWLFGWPFCPEAAYEAMMMHIPRKNPIWIDGVDMYANNNFSTEIQAKGTDYANKSLKDLRYLLALNSSNTTFEVTPEYSMCVVSVKYTSAVRQIGRIPINTSLFVYLQDKHILFPYEMVYFYMYV